MATYLVTGGAGFIGSHLVEALVNQGENVRVIDNFSTGSRANLAHVLDRIDLSDADITDMQAIRPAMQGVDYVLHQAAIPSVPRSVVDPALTHAGGATGTLNVLNIAARDAGVKRVVYAASSSAYGDIEGEYKVESMAPRPQSPYAVAKLTGEYYCEVFHRVYGLETVALRYFNVFGPRQDPNSPYSAVIPQFMTAMLADRRPTIYGDGTQSRDFTYIDNVVRGNLLACTAEGQRIAGQTMNLACGDKISLLELVTALNRLLGKAIEPVFAEPRPGDVKHSRADIGKARRLLDYQPAVSFEDGFSANAGMVPAQPVAGSVGHVKIVHVAKMTSIAGMEKQLLTLLPGLRRRGIDASLIVLAERDKPMYAYLEQMRQLGVPAERVVIGSDVDLGLIGRLASKIREGKYDAVHTHLIHADLHGVGAAQRAGIRQIYFTGHNDDRFRHRWPIRLLQGWLWRQVKGGIAISHALRDFMIHFEFAPPERVHVVHYGYEPLPDQVNSTARERLCGELGISLKAPIVGSICRLTEQKGLPHAIRAFWQIAEQVQGAHYVIVGDGPQRTALEQQVDGFRMKQRIHFLGWRDNATALLPAFDALLMPSLWEGFGMVALEAMAARVPVIASRVSALPEIVENGVTGYLAEPADPSALAECLLHVLGNPAMAREMGENGRRRLESEFGVERMVDGTLKVYESA